MKRIDFIWMTYNRQEQAERLRKALRQMIPAGGWEFRSVENTQTEPGPLPATVNRLFEESDAEIMVYLTDGVIPSIGLGVEIVRTFDAQFPALDGLVGLCIGNAIVKSQAIQFCHPAIGRAFYDAHLRGHGPACTDYHHHHWDSELGQFANEIGRFHFAQHAQLFVVYPAFGNMEPDDTYRAGRIEKAQDKLTRQARIAQGLLWGRSMESVKERTI
jgi:hypothetical protein